MAGEAHKPQTPSGATPSAGDLNPIADQAAVDAVESASNAAQAISDETGGVASGASTSDSAPLTLPDFGGKGPTAAEAVTLGLLDDVTLRVKVELGRTQIYIEDVLRLNANSVVELDKAAGDPVDVYVNERHVARGEVLVLNENFCVRISEIIQPALDG
jgi:flagellar motor switch protein FliN/FliY